MCFRRPERARVQRPANLHLCKSSWICSSSIVWSGAIQNNCVIWCENRPALHFKWAMQKWDNIDNLWCIYIYMAYLYIYMCVRCIKKNGPPILTYLHIKVTFTLLKTPVLTINILDGNLKLPPIFLGKKSSSSLVISRHPRGSTVMIFDTWKTTYVLI